MILARGPHSACLAGLSRFRANIEVVVCMGKANLDTVAL